MSTLMFTWLRGIAPACLMVAMTLAVPAAQAAEPGSATPAAAETSAGAAMQALLPPLMPGAPQPQLTGLAEHELAVGLLLVLLAVAASITLGLLRDPGRSATRR